MPQTAEQMRAEQKFVEAAIQKYCGWLNGLAPNGYQLQPSDQEVEPIARYAAPEYDVIALRVTIKQEDEPATVTLMHEEGRLVHATQSFDGGLSVWYEDGKPVNNGP
jgi:hypothetical protein